MMRQQHSDERPSSPYVASEMTNSNLLQKIQNFPKNPKISEKAKKNPKKPKLAKKSNFG
jgi:hypothetical protein